jgi:hypothetical protein
LTSFEELRQHYPRSDCLLREPVSRICGDASEPSEPQVRAASSLSRTHRFGLSRSGSLSSRLLTSLDALLVRAARQAKGRQYYKGDVNLPAFLTAQNLKPFISKDLEVTSSQIEFRTVRGTKAFGYPAELLPKVCEVFLKAREAGALKKNQEHVAAKAELLVRGLTNTGIVALVDEATGYQAVRPRDALQTYLEMILRKELAAWSKKFPDEFYENIYALKGWKWPGMQKNRYSVCAHYTTNLIYQRLAPGLLNELKRRSPKDEKGNRKNKLHQWLDEDFGQLYTCLTQGAGCPILTGHLEGQPHAPD